MNVYQVNRAESDRFIPQASAIIGQQLIVVAGTEQDTRESTDLILLSVGEKKITFRARRYDKRYRADLTLRAGGNGVKKSEAFKVLVEGNADWGFTTWHDGEKILYWSVVDFDELSECVRNARGEPLSTEWCLSAGIDKRTNQQDGNPFLVFPLPKLVRRYGASLIWRTNIPEIKDAMMARRQLSLVI